MLRITAVQLSCHEAVGAVGASSRDDHVRVHVEETHAGFDVTCNSPGRPMPRRPSAPQAPAARRCTVIHRAAVDVQRGAKPRVRVGTTAARLALMGMVLLLAVSAYFPFAWDPPRMVRNEVTRNADGSLQFGAMNAARTRGTPAWLPGVRTSGIVQIRLSIYPQSLREQASIMMLASDFWNTDFAIGQDRSDLLVWLRRPGSDGTATRPSSSARRSSRGAGTSVDLMLRRDSIRIHVNGRTRLTGHVPAESTRIWDRRADCAWR